MELWEGKDGGAERDATVRQDFRRLTSGDGTFPCHRVWFQVSFQGVYFIMWCEFQTQHSSEMKSCFFPRSPWWPLPSSSFTFWRPVLVLTHYSWLCWLLWSPDHTESPLQNSLLHASAPKSLVKGAPHQAGWVLPCSFLAATFCIFPPWWLL